jgi:hypothetical protein
MALSEVITRLIQAIEPLLTLQVDALEPRSLVLRLVTATITNAAEGPRAAGEGTTDARVVGGHRTHRIGRVRSIETQGRCDRLIRSLTSHVT